MGVGKAWGQTLALVVELSQNLRRLWAFSKAGANIIIIGNVIFDVIIIIVFPVNKNQVSRCLVNMPVPLLKSLVWERNSLLTTEWMNFCSGFTSMPSVSYCGSSKSFWSLSHWSLFSAEREILPTREWMNFSFSSMTLALSAGCLRKKLLLSQRQNEWNSVSPAWLCLCKIWWIIKTLSASVINSIKHHPDQ